jgi:DNA polymerase (family 10)
MDQRTVAQAFERIAALLELKGENPFRVRAFRTAAKAIQAIPGSLEEAVASGEVANTRGIGPATLQIVQDLLSTGRSSVLEELQERIPSGLVDMLQISGLGVAKVRQIHEALGIDSLPELETAARDGRLARLPRFGAKTADNVLRGIAFLRQASAYRLAHHAAEEAEGLRLALAALAGVEQAITAGDGRRRAELVRDLTFVLVAEVRPEELFTRIGTVPGVHELAGQDDRRVTLRVSGGSPARIIVTTPQNLGTVLVQATGSEAHLAALEAHATSHGFRLDGAALWQGSRFVPTRDEAEFYTALGLQPIPPELREGLGEVEAAAGNRLPRLVERSRLRGVLHCHTSLSDGTNTVEQLAQAARAAGYEWIGITDHSQAAAYAGGLNADDLQRQADEVAALNASNPGIRVLHGIEADILMDGALDLGDAVLNRLDFVIGSIHSRFGMGREAMTARLLAALDHPALTIMGHPTGRLLLAREPYPIDMEQVFRKASANGVAMEINADPHRLDLDWRLARIATGLGVSICLGVDAHSLDGLGYIEYGMGIARKAWLTDAQLLNTLTADRFLARAAARRR